TSNLNRTSSGSRPLSDVDELAGNRGGCGHRRRDQMCAALVALPALEIAIGRGRATFAGAEPVGIHGKAHRAAWLAPVEARFQKNLVKPFGLGLTLDETGAGHDHRRDP